MTDYIKDAILSGILETFEMTLFASLFSYIVGLPLGVILYATSKGRLLENRAVNGIIGFIVNVTSIGTVASIVPLTVGAIPIVARMVESSLSEVNPGIIEAATSMGASPLYTIVHFIIPEATPSLLQGGAINVATVLGYSAMAGVIGGGGLGAIALQYGYYRYQKDVLFTTVTLLIIMVMMIQEIGIFMSKKNRKT